MYRVTKISEGEIEYLPDIVETPLWIDYKEFDCRQSVKVLAMLYIAIAKRENYYQFNSPTAFGSPEFSYLRGVVFGILQGGGLIETIEDNQIIIKKNNRKKMVIDKIKRCSAYYASIKEISETMRMLGL